MSSTLTILTRADEMSEHTPGYELKALANLPVCFINTGIKYGVALQPVCDAMAFWLISSSVV